MPSCGAHNRVLAARAYPIDLLIAAKIETARGALAGSHDLKTKPPPACTDEGSYEWWPGTESNHRHADFQSAALPTELPGQDRQYNSPGAGYRREAKKFAALRLKFGPFWPLTGRCPAA